MKVENSLVATCYKVKKNVMESKKPGEPGIEWYQIIIDQNDNVGTLTCSKDVYDHVERGELYEFSAQYDEETKKYKVTGIIRKVKDKQDTNPFGETVPTAKPSK